MGFDLDSGRLVIAECADLAAAAAAAAAAGQPLEPGYGDGVAGTHCPSPVIARFLPPGPIPGITPVAVRPLPPEPAPGLAPGAARDPQWFSPVECGRCRSTHRFHDIFCTSCTVRERRPWVNPDVHICPHCRIPFRGELCANAGHLRCPTSRSSAEHPALAYDAARDKDIIAGAISAWAVGHLNATYGADRAAAGDARLSREARRAAIMGGALGLLAWLGPAHPAADALANLNSGLPPVWVHPDIRVAIISTQLQL
jgi:hypothetical protein